MATMSKVLIKVMYKKNKSISFFSTKERILRLETGDDPVFNNRISDIYEKLRSMTWYNAPKETTEAYPEYTITMFKN